MIDLMREAVLLDIKIERERQDAKWGEQNHFNSIWCSIAGEELGEVHQAVLHDKFGGRAAGTVYTEVLHLGAVGVQWLEFLKRDGVEMEGEVPDLLRAEVTRLLRLGDDPPNNFLWAAAVGAVLGKIDYFVVLTGEGAQGTLVFLKVLTLSAYAVLWMMALRETNYGK